MNKGILLEKIVRRILEAEEESAPGSKKSSDAENDRRSPAGRINAAFNKPLPGFVADLKTIIADPKVQAVLKAGQTDAAGPKDEALPYESTSLPVLNLKPTQNEIGFDQSIKNILTDQYGSLKSILDGNADVGGPIVTYNSQYVIDGHHRWSQVFAANPKAKMQALNIKGKLKPTEILKLVHAAVAIKMGEVPGNNPKGINILNGVTENQVLDSVNANLSEGAKKLWAENGQKSNEDIAKYINDNLQKLIKSNKPVPGAPGRVDMPQTDADKGPATTKLDILSKGAVNFDAPKVKDAEDLKEQRERLMKRAGL